MSKLVFAFVFLFSTLSYARPGYPNVAGQVYGGWIMPTFSEGGFTLNGRLYFNPSTMLAKSICSFRGVTLAVETSGRATYTANTISSISRAENTVSQNGLDCTAAVEPMTFNYIVTVNVLTLVAQGESLTLNREL